MKTDYRFICPRCNTRSGVPQANGFADIVVCVTCVAERNKDKRNADGKFPASKYRPKQQANGQIGVVL